MRQAVMLPDVFCWTKMQAEAGQSLDAIVYRKEAERRAGDGVFFWGVGNSSSKIRSYAERKELRVVFSLMKCRPKLEDENPKDLLMWTAFKGPDDIGMPLPAHVLVLSKAETARRPKDRHYALVCRSGSPLAIASNHMFEIGSYKNFDSIKDSVGDSQVTALLQKNVKGKPRRLYPVSFSADLAHPYFVRLCDPIKVMPEDRLELAEFDARREDNWIATVASLRRRKVSAMPPGAGVMPA